MDYSLAAVKMLSSQLRDAKPTPSQNATALGGVLFQRAWLQGVLVSNPVIPGGRMVLDDGTGLVELSLSSDFALRQWNSGFDTISVRERYLFLRFTRSLTCREAQIVKPCGI